MYCIAAVLLVFLFLGLGARPAEAQRHVLKIGREQAYHGMLKSDVPWILKIASGDSVAFNTHMLMEGRLQSGMGMEEVDALSAEIRAKKGGFYSFTGPFYVEDALPGDVLEVRVRRIVTGAWGMTMFFPHGKEALGIPELSAEGLVLSHRYSEDRKTMEFKPGITIPLRPFLGTMAVAPRSGEEYYPVDPGYYAGNMDIKEMGEGSTLFVPVNVEGALFMAADAHGVQGDGEVCGTASETWFDEVELEFFLHKGGADQPIKGPRAETPTHWIVMSFHEDLNQAMKNAIRDVVDFLRNTQNLSAGEAYALSSLAVDFRVAQFGMSGLKSLYAMIPKGIFRTRERQNGT